MFSAITIRSQKPGNSDSPLDVGNLLECLLFYKKVYVIATVKIIRQLVRAFGIDDLERLLESGSLQILFSSEFIAIHTDGKSNVHCPLFVDSDVSPKQSLLEQLRLVAVELTGKEGKGRRSAQRLEKLIHKVKYEESFRASIQPLLSDRSLVENVAKATLRILVPEYTGKIEFGAEQVQSGFVVHSNLDFVALNQLYHQRVNPKHSTLTPAVLLSYVCEAESHMYFAARQLSELCIDPVGSALVEARFVHLAQRSKKSDLERQAFAELVLDDAKTVREAFNKGTIPIAEIIRVILAADRFKDWLIEREVDKSVIREYYREISKETFIEKLPGKTSRWAILTTLGFLTDAILPLGIGKATDMAFSILDSFFLDKFAKGWKPNQFVDEELAPLLNQAVKKHLK